MVLALYLHLLLGFDGLMQPVAPASSGHEATGELVNYYYLAVLHDVIHVFPEKHVRPKALIDVVERFYVARVVEIIHAKQFLDLGHAVLGKENLLILLFHRVVRLDFQKRHYPVYLKIPVRGFLCLPRYYERGARLVYEYRVNLVHYREIEIPLDVIV